MALTAIDKVKVAKYLNANAISNLCYLDLCDALGKRGKIRDVEFLEHFVDVAVNELKKDNKISFKYLSKVISCVNVFLIWIHDSGTEIPLETLDKIRSFDEYYSEYLARTGNCFDEVFSNESLVVVANTINELYPCEKHDESLVIYLNKIDELEEIIKDLKKQLRELNKKNNSLQKDYEKEKDELDFLKEEVSPLKEELRVKKHELSDLNKVIESLNTKIVALEQEVSRLSLDSSALIELKEQYSGLLLEYDVLKKDITSREEAKKRRNDIRIREEELEKLIYQKLLTDKCSIDDLVSNAKNLGFTTDKKEIYGLLARIKDKINVESNSFSLSPSYKISSPSILTDSTFSLDIPKGCKVYDIMLVSDFHIREINSSVLKEFDMLNNYCNGHGIKLILNLGDFYHGCGHLYYKDAVNNYKLVEDSITKIPRVGGVYHAILGGNHDKRLLKYGFDPLEFLSREREDFINLGYTHSAISLNGKNGNIVDFDIHHPDTFDFQIDLTNDGLDVSSLINYLNSILSNTGRSRKDSYIDILGHSHKSQINFFDSYCFLPPFFEETKKRGACHLKIYFDENEKIKYMVFMPLTCNEKMIKNNEIFYQKVLKK